LSLQLGQKSVGIGDEPGHLISALRKQGGGLVGVGQQIAELLITSIQCLGEARHTVHRGLEIRRCVLERL